MRVKCALGFLFFCLFLLPTMKVHAASTTAYKDYLYQYDQYRTKQNNFKVARTEYLKYKTLLSETTALDTVKSMLTQQDQLLRSYLLFLVEKLTENTGLSSTDKNLYQTLMQNEVTFLQTHAALVPSIGSLSDAVTVAKQLESHYLVLQIAIRQTIIALGQGDLTALHTKFTTTYTPLTALARSGAAGFSAEKQSTIERWILQIDNKQSLFTQKMNQITTANSQIKGTTEDEMNARFVAVQKNLAEAKQYLIEANSYMQELITLLQYKN